jgi:hypothetical protein
MRVAVQGLVCIIGLLLDLGTFLDVLVMLLLALALALALLQLLLMSLPTFYKWILFKQPMLHPLQLKNMQKWNAKVFRFLFQHDIYRNKDLFGDPAKNCHPLLFYSVVWEPLH